VKRRVMAVLVSLVLAAIGGFLVLSYAANADRRAVKDMEPVDVLVATKLIAKGTSTNDIAASVTLRPLPSIATVQGALTSVAEIAGQVAIVDIAPGEQLLGSRFADPATLAGPGAVPAPKGMQQISIKLESQRVVGGDLKAGDTVGVFLSVGDKPAGVTHLTIHKVLVTKMQVGAASSGADDKSAGPAVDASLLVTLATSAANAERIVFAAEYGTIWLSSEPADAVVTGTQTISAQNLYR
jgi:pilus assembly protein CpaB